MSSNSSFNSDPFTVLATHDFKCLVWVEHRTDIIISLDSSKLLQSYIIDIFRHRELKSDGAIGDFAEPL